MTNPTQYELEQRRTAALERIAAALERLVLPVAPNPASPPWWTPAYPYTPITCATEATDGE